MFIVDAGLKVQTFVLDTREIAEIESIHYSGTKACDQSAIRFWVKGTDKSV